MLTLTHKEQGGASIVKVEGRLELTSVDRFQKTFRELVLPGSPVVLDLSAVTHVDSSGISALVSLHQRTREFYLWRPAPPLANLLVLANLNRYFKLLTDEELARKFPP